jgi:hypothetical protein
MKIHAGYQIAYECPQPTPMLLMLHVHPSRAPDLITADDIRLNPSVEHRQYRDGFGNICTRVLAPAGRLEHARSGGSRRGADACRAAS